MEKEVKCPRCESTQLSANQRGWNLTTGFIGSGKVIITCLNCGNRFRPGDHLTQEEKNELYKKQSAEFDSTTAWQNLLKIVILLAVIIITFKFCSV